MASDKKRLSAAKCTALNRRGERCGAIAGSDGLCEIHAGRADPAELGRRGGLASVRSRFGLDGIADDDLREKARQRLNAMLDSSDEKTRLAAARALFSYGATPPNDGRPAGCPAASVAHDHRAIRDNLERFGVIAYREASEAEKERLGELRAEVEALRAERDALAQRVAELEGRSE
jgi:hypothetical protein